MNVNRRRSGGLSRNRHSLAGRARKRNSFINSSSISSREQQESCIKVVVRSRPVNSAEIGKGHEVVTVVDNHLLMFDTPQEEEGFFFRGRRVPHRDLNKRANKNVSFYFDRVFDGTSSNDEIFNESVKPVVDSLLAGFNCSVFAYGATGAGKTYTMLGAEQTPGIIYLIIQELFQRVQQLSDKSCDITVSYLEVYNELVKDLLRPTSPLQIRDDSKGVTVVGLSYQKPTTAEGLLHVLRRGNENRTQHPTDANAESSRSHAVFQIYLTVKNSASGLSENIQLSKMSLIDLAGSERNSVISNHGKARLREGANINQSLLALGTCINALAAKNGKKQHVPYRNSKLTRILKDSLGGNCRTVMIAAVSPSSLSYDDTYNTLKYAERAKGIRIELKRNTAHVDTHIADYKKALDSLQQENETLKRQLAEARNQPAKRQKTEMSDVYVQTSPVHANTLNTQTSQEEQISSILDQEWKSSVDSLIGQLTKLKKNLLDCESNLLSTQARQFWRQSAHSRLTVVTADPNRITRSHSKLDTLVKSNQAKMERLNSEKNNNMEAYQQSMKNLNALCSSKSSMLEQVYVQMKKTEMEVSELKTHLSHTVDLSTANFKQTNSAWKLCEQALQHARMLHSTLKGHGYLTSQLTSEFEDLVKQAECGREVAWADEPPAPDPHHQEFLQQLLLPSSVFSMQFIMPGTSAVSCGSKGIDNVEQKLTVPTTPCKSPTFPVLSSPPVSSTASPMFSKGIRQRPGSPHSNAFREPSNDGLLALIAKDEPVRKSLEETFISSSQDYYSVGTSRNWNGMEKVNLMDITFSPVGAQKPCRGSEINLYMSTPMAERPRTLGAESFTISRSQDPRIPPHNGCNNHFMPGESCHSQFQMESGPHAMDGGACQQMPFHSVQGCCMRQPHNTACDGYSMGGTPRGAPYSMLPPRAICPETVSRPGRFPPPNWNQQVSNFAASSRNIPIMYQRNNLGLKPRGPPPDLRQMPVVSSSTGNFRATGIRGRVPKENLDPQKMVHTKPARRYPSGPQKRASTPAQVRIVKKTGK